MERPAISGTVTPLSGCIPATVSFNSSVVLPPASSVSTYTWNFGDGSPQVTTTANSSTHNYNAVGDYTQSSASQQRKAAQMNSIFPHLPLEPLLLTMWHIRKKRLFVDIESPEFVSKAVNANKYFWDFGEGDTTSVLDTIVEHKFRTLGIKTITVTPLYNDCPGTPISFSIEVIGVIAGFKYSNTCATSKRFDFTNTSQGNLSTILWTFGDGSPNSQQHNVVHSYPDTGTFRTTLSILDSITGCDDTLITDIYTAIPFLVNPDSSICKNSNTTFTIPGNYSNPNALYNWHVVGMEVTSDTTPLTINASILGHFNNNYVVIDNGVQYCPDTIYRQGDILVRGPQLTFEGQEEICVSKPWHFTNSSQPYVPTDIINEWHWLYGITNETDSVYQPAPHYFPYWGLFDIKLSATDIKGCTDTLVKQVNVYDIPFLRTIPDTDTLCSGNNSTLIAFHNDPITWSPTNAISCSTCDTIVASPSSTTTYFVTATNRFNCSVTDSVVIQVYEPFNAVAAKPSNYICANESVQLDISPKDKYISWSPATSLSDSTIFNPVASPKETTHYRVTLRDSVGCFSSSTDINIYVKPLPTVNAGPDMIYPYNTTYAITPAYSSNVKSYYWSPSTLLNCNDCPAPVGISTTSQNYTITVTSDSGCIAKDNIAIVVECKNANLLLPTAFTPNSDNINDYYYPITRGIKKISRFSIYSREGILVYEARDMLPNDRNRGWNGKYRGMPQTSAAYVYFLDVVCEAGETITKKGSFVLMR